MRRASKPVVASLTLRNHRLIAGIPSDRPERKISTSRSEPDTHFSESPASGPTSRLRGQSPAATVCPGRDPHSPGRRPPQPDPRAMQSWGWRAGMIGRDLFTEARQFAPEGWVRIAQRFIAG